MRSDAELAVSAAQAGARVPRRWFGKPLARFAKQGDDFATSADIDAELAIAEMVLNARPADAR
ncbi:MAG TPA: hypothetical protein VH561_16040 [Micromonosporaceae bacterium]|jgi:myo-inositol-1(or 4)-monophosphatase